MSEERGLGECQEVGIVIIIINPPRGGMCYRPSTCVDNGMTFFLSDCVIDFDPRRT